MEHNPGVGNNNNMFNGFLTLLSPHSNQMSFLVSGVGFFVVVVVVMIY